MTMLPQMQIQQIVWMQIRIWIRIQSVQIYIPVHNDILTSNINKNLQNFETLKDKYTIA